MSPYRNLSLFLILAAVWGSAFMAINLGVEYLPPVLFAALRYEIAGVLMLGYAFWVVDDPIPRGREQWLLVAVAAVFLIAAYHALLFIGQTDPLVTSAIAAVIVSLSPLLTTVFARLLLPSERLTVLGIIGLMLGLAGAIVLANPDPSNLAADGALPKLLVFFATVAFALGSVLTRRIDAQMRIETMEGWAMLLGGILMHILSLGMGESMADIQWTVEAVAALAYLSIAASAIGFLIYFDLLDRLGPIEINLVSYVAPIFAAIAGWIFLQEGLTVTTVVGFVLIFTGFGLLKRKAIRSEFTRRWSAPSAD
ncbi:EamA family transporter [Halorubraceae archaeon YAN]|nr:EamA family transporter [Halorubraceae archaeon YAN]